VAFAVAVAVAASRAVDAAAEHAARMPSAADVVFQSRQTPPVASGGNGALLAFAVILTLAVLAGGLMFLYAKAAREWRLVNKKSRPVGPRIISPPGHLPALADGEMDEAARNAALMAVERARRLRQLPRLDSEQGGNYGY